MTEVAPHLLRTLVVASKRGIRTLALCVLVLGSLLAFPSMTAWMIAIWLIWHSISVIGGRPGWLPLTLCATIIIVKRVAWMPGLVVLETAFAAVLLLSLTCWWRRTDSIRQVVWISLTGLWLAWAAMAEDQHLAVHSSRLLAIDPARPIVCLGDSLTSMGRAQGGYPEALQEIVSLPVINMGEPGITTDDALKRLPDVLAQHPQTVVVELGGHDFLKGRSRQDTETNLAAIVEACRESGAEVVLIEIPRGLVSDGYAGLERRLARKHDLELVPDTPIRQIVLWSAVAPPGAWFSGPHFSDDGLHPNAHGERHLAAWVASSLERLYGREIIQEEP